MNDNANVRDELMNETEFVKERFDCSALFDEVLQTANEEAEAIDQPLLERNMQFVPRNNGETDLTEARHRAKRVAYVVSPERADEALAAKCDSMHALGFEVFLRGAADWR